MLGVEALHEEFHDVVRGLGGEPLLCKGQSDCEALLVGHGYRIVHKDRTNMMLVLEDQP